MKYGALRAEDTGIRYDQTNNVIERFLLDLKIAGLSSFWLESCNIEASACAVGAVDGVWKAMLPTFEGKPIVGYGDLIFAFAYSDYGQKYAPVSKEGVNENEFPVNLAFYLRKLANVQADVRGKSIDGMKADLKNGCALVLSYLTDYDSGHFITVVQYDEDKKVFRCYDSWKGNKHCKNGGVLEEYPDSFFAERARPTYIAVKKL